MASNQVNPASPVTRSAADELIWECREFAELTPDDLYAALELRQRVFVVEQNCTYMDCDGVDPLARHLFGWQGSGASRRLLAYARIFPPRAKYAESSIGRVVTHPDVRGSGGGRSLMAESLRFIDESGWGPSVRIAAQTYLERFYEQFGFRRASEPYTEDNIWHVDMLRA